MNLWIDFFLEGGSVGHRRGGEMRGDFLYRLSRVPPSGKENRCPEEKRYHTGHSPDDRYQVLSGFFDDFAQVGMGPPNFLGNIGGRCLRKDFHPLLHPQQDLFSEIVEQACKCHVKEKAPSQRADGPSSPCFHRFPFFTAP